MFERINESEYTMKNNKKQVKANVAVKEAKQENKLSKFEAMKQDKAHVISNTFRNKITEAKVTRVFSAITKVIESNKLTLENVSKFSNDNASKYSKEAMKLNAKLKDTMKELKATRVFSFLVSKELNLSLSACNEELSEIVNNHNRKFVASFLNVKEDNTMLEIARVAHYKKNI